MLNRGKQSMAVDLKSPADMEVLWPLIEKADALIEEFRPGGMDRLGLGYDVLAKRNPRLIYCSIPSWDQTGPKAGKGNRDLNFVAEAGLLGLSAGNYGVPALPVFLAGDIAGGAPPVVINILLALRQRGAQAVAGAMTNRGSRRSSSGSNNINSRGRTMERHEAGVKPGGVDDHILQTRGLTMEFHGFVAVCNVDLNVRRHTIHALIGPNGAGKTTCFNLLTKFLIPTGGSIVFNGRDVTRTGPAAMARLGMVRSFQISSIFSHLTVIENVRMALQRKLGTSFHFWKPKRSLYPLHVRADELIELVGLETYRDTLAGDLSYGRKRVLELATTLALDPELLLLDEPMAGLGHEDIGRVTELVRRVSEGRTVLMVEHNLDVVSDLSDTITVLTRGSILAEGDYASVSQNPAVREAYIGGVHA